VAAPPRCALHRRLAETADEADVRRLRAEMADRYGPPPPPAVRLLRLAGLRIRCARRGLARIEVRGDRAWLFRGRGREPLLAGGRLPRVAGRTADQKLAALFRIVEAAR
jgi:hypothetical protein